MTFKFEKLEVWQLALVYLDEMYALADCLPREEEFNLKAQLRRAATSISLNIAEGSTGQSNAEQARFVAMAIRSLYETVACQRLIAQRQYVADREKLSALNAQAETLARKLQALRAALVREKSR